MNYKLNYNNALAGPSGAIATSVTKIMVLLSLIICPWDQLRCLSVLNAMH
jgi:hypothetical protein